MMFIFLKTRFKKQFVILWLLFVQKILKFSKHQNNLSSLLNCKVLSPSPRISDSLGLVLYLKICLNKVLGASDITSSKAMYLHPMQHHKQHSKESLLKGECHKKSLWHTEFKIS